MNSARVRLLLGLAVAAVLLVGGAALAQVPAPTPTQPAVAHVLFAPMTFSVEIDPSLYTNPFDSADIELVGIFTAPSGRQVVIPGFWMQPYTDTCVEPCLVENLQPSGDPVWQVRFAPDEVGDWSYILQVSDDGTISSSQTGEFSVEPSDRPGFIHVSANQRYFQYDAGQSYFPIGHNLNWSWDAGGGLVAYRQWLTDLSASGGNYARLLIDDPFFIGLEWNSAAGDYRASQKEAARLDTILDMAAEYGVSLQIVVLWHQALITYQGLPVVPPENPARPDTSADWDNYGYNVLNGGPLSGPGVFFASEQAQDLFRRRLRYIAARWGYSPQIFAWEMIDEIDHTTNYNAQTAAAWLQTMAGYLRQVDQNRHLITAGSRDFDPTIVDSPVLDLTQARFYQRRPFETVADQVVGSVDAIRQNLEAANVPTLLTAFSLNPWFESTAEDAKGISVQTTIWASAFSGAGGSAMSAFGETYVVPQELQRYYPPLAAFASVVDWAQLDLKPADAALLADDDSLYQSLQINNFLRHYGEPNADPATHLITSDGVVPDAATVSSYLYGQLYNKAWHQPQQYRVAISHPTTFEARVRSTSTQAGARLVIQVDGKTAAELVLDAGAKDVALRVPLTVGEHTITLENQGDDWLQLDSLKIGAFSAPVRVLTLRDADAGVALSWLQYRSYTWDRLDEPRPPLLFRYRLDGMPVGRYAVELWSPLTGAVIGQELTTVGTDGTLSVDLVPMSDELALRAVRQTNELPTATSIPSSTPIPSLTPTTFSIETNTPLPTSTPSDTATPTPTSTATATFTATPTYTYTATPAPTHTPTDTDTPTLTATRRPTRTARPTTTPAPSATSTDLPTETNRSTSRTAP